MSDNLFISEVLFAIVATIAFLVFWQFYRTRNGVLRKIMMLYFLIEFFIYAASGLYFWMAEQHYNVISIETFRLVVIVPKCLVKCWLLYYLVRNK